VKRKIFVGIGLSSLLTLHVALAADTYKIDPSHTSVGFSISHLIISEVEGRFNDVAGEVTLTDDSVTGAKATIQAKSIDTHIGKRDEDLRSAKFFDVEKYPTITFESTKIEKEGDKTYIAGKLTMHGVTKEIRFPFVAKGPIDDPWGNKRIGLVAETSLNRSDYGMKPFPGVGDTVKLKISAEAIKSKDEKTAR
jgi:polyisoprenoid-binding protein YceI